MVLTLSNLKPAAGSKIRKFRVGRGNSSGRGTYSGRGLKGQRSRSGGRGGLKLLGLKSRLQKIPKLRGFRSVYPKVAVVNLGDLEKHFTNGSVINPKRLFNLGLIEKVGVGVKILGSGKLTKKLTIEGCQLSQGAKAQIEKAGGKVV
jgi:large subunit ribosomal protein L15